MTDLAGEQELERVNHGTLSRAILAPQQEATAFKRNLQVTKTPEGPYPQ